VLFGFSEVLMALLDPVSEQGQMHVCNSHVTNFAGEPLDVFGCKINAQRLVALVTVTAAWWGRSEIVSDMCAFVILALGSGSLIVDGIIVIILGVVVRAGCEYSSIVGSKSLEFHELSVYDHVSSYLSSRPGLLTVLPDLFSIHGAHGAISLSGIRAGDWQNTALSLNACIVVRTL
jgi:hypothetical protein